MLYWWAASWRNWARIAGAETPASMPPRLRRAMAAVTSTRVMRARKISWATAGSASAWTQAVPISGTYRLTIPLASQK
jgi:hypothetical protein